MREIKFRAWDKKEKIMINEALEIKNIGLGEGSVIVDKQTQKGNELIWMCCTGFKDKAGHEIFDGDVLDGDFPDLVFWNKVTGQWMLQNSENPNDTLWEIVRDNNPMVIGNIYENSELLLEV